MPIGSTWLAAALAGPALLLGPTFPGFGTLREGVPLPPPLAQAIARADAAPETGGVVAFNDPSGSRRQQYALVHRINRAIDDAVPGATVRLAAYSLAMPPTTRALLRAHDRGVAVRVVVDGHSAHWGAVRALRAALGSDRDAESFVRVCRLSCRGGRGNQHAKFVTVSGDPGSPGSPGSSGSSGSTGSRVLVGSVNLTRYNATRQWNDLYTVADAAIHDQFARAFELMAADRPQARLRLPETARGFRTDVSPYRTTRADPIAHRLHAVRCRRAGLIAGRDGRTVVRIAMHAWNGDRGLRLARRVVRLHRRGCDVKVLYGVGMGRRVATTLRAAGVPTRDSAHRGDRVHHKVMVVSGALGRQRAANYVWTGSHNWSDRSVRNDEVTLRISGRGLVEDYLRNFNRIWRVAGR